MRSLGVLALVLALLGCAGSGVENSDDIEQRFDDRARLPDCGVIEAGHERMSDAGPEAWACFFDARKAGEPAELAVTFLTVEGDPIREWYRLTEDGAEVYTDNTADSFGTQEWTFRTCDTLRPSRWSIDCVRPRDDADQ